MDPELFTSITKYKHSCKFSTFAESLDRSFIFEKINARKNNLKVIGTYLLLNVGMTMETQLSSWHLNVTSDETSLLNKK